MATGVALRSHSPSSSSFLTREFGGKCDNGDYARPIVEKGPSDRHEIAKWRRETGPAKMPRRRSRRKAREAAPMLEGEEKES